jgi:ectoine hydroxylase-related dioxygenase (phytanoyl-CoA dioxygenase family)
VLDADRINIRVRTIVNKGEIFELLVQDPLVAEVMSTMLGERFIVSTFDSYTTNPGGGPERELHEQSPLRIHSDTGYIHYPHPPYHLAASAFWMLDDFTEYNGATRYVPGSHRRTDRLDRAESYPERAITGPAGSLGFIHGELWHHAGPKTTADRSRRGLFAC